MTKVDIMTGSTLPIPDTLLEVEGMDALALDKDNWPEVREELRNKIGGVRAVLIRQIENVESSLIRCVTKLMWASERSHLGTPSKKNVTNVTLGGGLAGQNVT